MCSVLQLNRFPSTTFTFDVLRWLNVHKRLELNTLNFIQKMKIGEAGPYRLRHANNFRLQPADTSTMQKSIYYKGLNMYNKMANFLMNERNINVFRKNVVNFVKNNSS